MATRQVNCHGIIDSSAIGRRQYVILAFSSLLVLFDGVDTQVITFIVLVLVLVLAKQWYLPKADFGPLFFCCIFWSTNRQLRSLLRHSVHRHQKTTIVAIGPFGSFTLLAAFASNLPELNALRVLTGIGLGAVTPCVVSLVSESSLKERVPRLSC